MADINDLTDDSTAVTWKELEQWSLVGKIKKTKSKDGRFRGVSFVLADGAGKNSRFEIKVDDTHMVPMPASIHPVIQALVVQGRISQDKATSLINEIQNLLNKKAQHRSLANQVQLLLPHHVRLHNTCSEKENVVDDIWKLITPLVPSPRRDDYKKVPKSGKWNSFDQTQRTFKIALAEKILEAYIVERPNEIIVNRFIVLQSQAEVDQLHRIFETDLQISATNYVHGAYDVLAANQILQEQLAKPRPKPFMDILRYNDGPFCNTQWIVDGSGQLWLPRSSHEVDEVMTLKALPEIGPAPLTDRTVKYRTTRYKNGE